MIDFIVKPKLKFIRFDEKKDTHVEIIAETGSQIEFNRGNYRIITKGDPHPRDARDGWGGWTHSQKISVGDYIAIYETGLMIMTEKEFKRFFVEIQL